MKKKDENLKSFREDELKKRLGDLEEEMRAMKFKAEGAKPKDVKKERTLRKEIARTLTELNNPERKKDNSSKEK